MEVKKLKDDTGRTYYRVPEFKSPKKFESFVLELTKRLQGRIVENTNVLNVKICQVLFDNTTIVFDIDPMGLPLGIRTRQEKQDEETQLQRVLEYVKNFK